METFVDSEGGLIEGGAWGEDGRYRIEGWDAYWDRAGDFWKCGPPGHDTKIEASQSRQWRARAVCQCGWRGRRHVSVREAVDPWEPGMFPRSNPARLKAADDGDNHRAAVGVVP